MNSRMLRTSFIGLMVVSLLVGGLAASAPALAIEPSVAGAPPAISQAADAVEIEILWWGETEAPGSEKWLQAAQAEFQKQYPNVTFTNNLQSTDAFMPALEAAAAAKAGPTIEYLWGGVFVLDAVWKGWLVPISDYVGMDEAQHYINRGENTWDGKVWAAAWYLVPSFPAVYNKQAFKDAGLDPDKPPATWDEFLAACDAFGANGKALLAIGLKDKWGAGRPWENWQTDELDGMAQALEATVGDASFEDSPWLNYFTRWQEVIDHKCLPDDVMSQDMYGGQQLVVSGKAGLTMITGAEIASYAKQIGPDNTGVMILPNAGKGTLAGKMGSTSQTFAITTWASDEQKRIAAEFIKFMHTPAQLKQYYDMTGVVPADDRFDPASVTDPLVKQATEWAMKNGRPVVENFVPYDIAMNGNNDAMVGMVTGQIKSPEEAAKFMQSYAQGWQSANQLLIEQYRQWLEQVKAAGL